MMTISAVLAAAAFATKVCPFCDLTFTDDFDYCTECGAKLPVLGPVTGTIRVMPKTAGIYVDGIYKSAGSARIQVKPGAVVKVRVSAPGYDTMNKDWSYNDAARTSELIITLTKVDAEKKKTTKPNLGATRAFAVALGSGVALPVGDWGESWSYSQKNVLRGLYKIYPPLHLEFVGGYNIKHKYNATSEFDTKLALFHVGFGGAYEYQLKKTALFWSLNGGYYFAYSDLVSRGPGGAAGVGIRVPFGRWFIDCGGYFNYTKQTNEYITYSVEFVDVIISGAYYLL